VENNNILRRLRYTFDLDDSGVMALFSTEEEPVTRAQISSWLKHDEDDDFERLGDAHMARFLDAFIVLRRGPRDGPPRPTELRLTNNIVLRKLKIALNLHEADMLRLMKVGGLPISKPELSALFRRAGHKHYRDCQDQFLRKFLVGVQKELGPDVED
jgi:uncharacterized protein YehS (DUF1456 family)